MVKIELNNQRAFFFFIGGIFALSFFNIWMILNSYDNWFLISMPYVIFGLISVALLVFRPNIMSFTIVRLKNVLMVNSGLSEEHILMIKGVDIMDYRLSSEMGKQVHNLVIYKRGPKGIMKSPDFRMVFFKSADVETLVKYLELNKQQNKAERAE